MKVSFLEIFFYILVVANIAVRVYSKWKKKKEAKKDDKCNGEKS